MLTHSLRDVPLGAVIRYPPKGKSESDFLRVTHKRNGDIHGVRVFPREVACEPAETYQQRQEKWDEQSFVVAARQLADNGVEVVEVACSAGSGEE